MTHEHRHLLAKVMAEGFALDDALLFLDTHPDDETALSYYQERQEAYRLAMQQYEEACAPLRMDALPPAPCHIWACSPWPWETEA